MMKSEQEIREKIKSIEADYAHVLNIPPASTLINTPRAIMQISARTQLDMLYFILNEPRPTYACDDFSKLDR